jgi:hypothetical protein
MKDITCTFKELEHFLRNQSTAARIEFINSRNGSEEVLWLFQVETERLLQHAAFSRNNEKLFIDANHYPTLSGALHALEWWRRPYGRAHFCLPFAFSAGA